MKVRVSTNNTAVVRVPVMTGPQGPQGPVGPNRTIAFTSMSLTSQQLTTITTQSSWTKVLGGTAISPSSNGFTMPQNNRLVSSLNENGVAVVNGMVDLTSSNDNQVISFAVALDGSVVANTVVRKRMGVGSNVEQVALVGDFLIVPGQTVEVWVMNETSSGDVTISGMYLGVSVHRPF